MFLTKILLRYIYYPFFSLLSTTYLSLHFIIFIAHLCCGGGKSKVKMVMCVCVGFVYVRFYDGNEGKAMESPNYKV